MRKFFVEFGPVHNRSFVDSPPARPLGKVVEVTEAEYEQLHAMHPASWGLLDGRIHTSKFSIRSYKPKSTVSLLVVGFIAGLLLGLIL